MGLVQGNVWGVSMDQKFLKDTPQFYSFSSVVHAEFCWICGLFPQYARARSWKNFQPRARKGRRAHGAENVTGFG